jgi:hypothetical protein
MCIVVLRSGERTLTTTRKERSHLRSLVSRDAWIRTRWMLGNTYKSGPGPSPPPSRFFQCRRLLFYETMSVATSGEESDLAQTHINPSISTIMIARLVRLLSWSLPIMTIGMITQAESIAAPEASQHD